MSRKYIDCREYPSETKCSLLLAGEENEVLEAAVEHAISVHVATDSPELRAELRARLRDEPEEWSRRVPKQTLSTSERDAAHDLPM